MSVYLGNVQPQRGVQQMSRTYSFNWAANHGIVFTHTHTPRFQQFCSPQSGPTLGKVKPGEFPASAPEATSLAFRFWDAGSGRGRLRLSPRCTSFVASSAAGAGPALSRPVWLPQCLPTPRRCPWQLHGYHPFCLQPDLPQNHSPAALRQSLCDVNHLSLLYNPCPIGPLAGTRL